MLEDTGGGRAALALAFHPEQAVIDVTAQLDELRKVLEAAPDLEVVGIVEGCLGAEGTVTLPVLLDAGVATADLQAGVHLLGEETDADRLLTAAAGLAAVEDDLDLLGAAEIDLLQDDLLEEVTAVERALPRAHGYSEACTRSRSQVWDWPG